MLKNEKGITLVALIITIIVLVILAAVSISIVYKNNMINHAVNGAKDYSDAAIREQEELENTVTSLESDLTEIKSKMDELSNAQNRTTNP